MIVPVSEICIKVNSMRFFAILGLSAALVVAGCNRKPEGQVAAVVDGDDITLAEINAELGQQQIPDGVDKQGVRRAALDRIVQRRLLAMVARDDKIDHDPAFLIRQREFKDTVLIQMLAQKATRAQPVPDRSVVDAYIGSHPHMFGEHGVLDVERIQFVAQPDPAKLKALEAAHDLDTAALMLAAQKVPYARGAEKFDTARLSATAIGQMKSLPKGEPFILRQNGLVTVGVIKGRVEAPITGDQARKMAVEAIRNEQVTMIIEKRLKAQKAKVKIEYQKDFAPPAASAR